MIHKAKDMAELVCGNLEKLPVSLGTAYEPWGESLVEMVETGVVAAAVAQLHREIERKLRGPAEHQKGHRCVAHWRAD